MSTKSDPQQLRMAWWNTSLAPLAKRRDQPDDLGFALSTIKALVLGESIDFLVLGEVSSELLAHFVEALDLPDIDSFDGTEADGRLHYDIGVLYRKSKCRIINTRVVRSEYARSALKLAVRLDVQVYPIKLPIHVFAVHWPSRLWCTQNSAKRDTLGYRLRDAARDLIDEYPTPPQIVFIGDFNDDPSDEFLACHLLATRDRSLARSHGDYFYNPFWRHLGESHAHVPGNPCKSIGGTYFCPSGSESRWMTFDQIIVSSALINPDDWELHEPNTGIWKSVPLLEALKKSTSIFDHLPITAEFTAHTNRNQQ